MTENLVHRQALACAERGWPVFPCQAGTKIPATPHGYRDATTDPAQIREWFSVHPDLNLAVTTGAPAFDVLDIDQRGDAGNGFASLRRLHDAGLLAAASRRIATPGGGLHYYFAGSRQRTAHLPACHVDFLAQGGYVMIPPSRIDGRPYQVTHFLPGRGGLDWATTARVLEPSREHPPAPPSPPAGIPAQQRIDALAHWVAAQREGNRNAGLYWAANRALETDRAADLSPLAAAARQAGLPEPEITRTLNSARRTTQARPEPPGREAEDRS